MDQQCYIIPETTYTLVRDYLIQVMGEDKLIGCENQLRDIYLASGGNDDKFFADMYSPLCVDRRENPVCSYFTNKTFDVWNVSFNDYVDTRSIPLEGIVGNINGMYHIVYAFPETYSLYIIDDEFIGDINYWTSLPGYGKDFMVIDSPFFRLFPTDAFSAKYHFAVFTLDSVSKAMHKLSPLYLRPRKIKRSILASAEPIKILTDSKSAKRPKFANVFLCYIYIIALDVYELLFPPGL